MRLLASLILLSGCGSDSAAMTRLDAIRAWAESSCQSALECEEGFDEAAYQRCVELRVEATSTDFTCYSAPVAEECVEAWETLECDQAAYSTFPCADAFRRPPCGQEPQ